MNAIEIAGFVTGAVSVWLAAREHVWNWPIGIANSACWLVLFWTSRLFLDSTLQLGYVGLGLAGWYWWLHGGDGRDILPIARITRRLVFVLVIGAVVVTAGLWWLDSAVAHSAMPFWDASTTVASLVATYLLGRKLIVNWWIWIGVDLAYIWMYTVQHLYLTAALQPLFIAMCIIGVVGWRRSLDADPNAIPTPVAGTEVVG
jgi:nicotinamide mononucleotide transporter